MAGGELDTPASMVIDVDLAHAVIASEGYRRFRCLVATQAECSDDVYVCFGVRFGRTACGELRANPFRRWNSLVRFRPRSAIRVAERWQAPLGRLQAFVRGVMG